MESEKIFKVGKAQKKFGIGDLPCWKSSRKNLILEKIFYNGKVVEKIWRRRKFSKMEKNGNSVRKFSNIEEW